MLVIDASAMVKIIHNQGDSGGRARELIEEQKLWAPSVLDLEVGSALRRHVLIGE